MRVNRQLWRFLDRSAGRSVAHPLMGQKQQTEPADGIQGSQELPVIGGVACFCPLQLLAPEIQRVPPALLELLKDSSKSSVRGFLGEVERERQAVVCQFSGGSQGIF